MQEARHLPLMESDGPTFGRPSFLSLLSLSSHLFRTNERVSEENEKIRCCSAQAAQTCSSSPPRRARTSGRAIRVRMSFLLRSRCALSLFVFSAFCVSSGVLFYFVLLICEYEYECGLYLCLCSCSVADDVPREATEEGRG